MCGILRTHNFSPRLGTAAEKPSGEPGQRERERASVVDELALAPTVSSTRGVGVIQHLLGNIHDLGVENKFLCTGNASERQRLPIPFLRTLSTVTACRTELALREAPVPIIEVLRGMGRLIGLSLQKV